MQSVAPSLGPYLRPKRREPVTCASTVEVECTYGHRLKGVSVATCLPTFGMEISLPAHLEIIQKILNWLCCLYEISQWWRMNTITDIRSS